MLSSLCDQGRRSTPNWDRLISRQREKKDGRIRQCLFHFCLEMAHHGYLHFLLFARPMASQPQGSALSGVGKNILSQDGGWAGRNSKCFDNNIIYHKGNGKWLAKCLLPFSSDRRRCPIIKKQSFHVCGTLWCFHNISDVVSLYPYNQPGVIPGLAQGPSSS